MNDQKDRQVNSKSDQQTRIQWIVVVLVIAVLGAAGLMAARSTRRKIDVSTEGGTIVAQRGNLMVTVTEGGTVRARNSIQYMCQVEEKVGAVKILEIVPAGTYITQEDVDNGKVLIKLNSAGLEDQLVREQMELSTRRQGATAAREAYDIQGIQNESTIARDKLAVRFALLDLQKYLGATLAYELVKDVDAIDSLTDHVAPIIAQAQTDPNILAGSQAAQELKSLQDSIVVAQGSSKNAQATLVGTEQLHNADYVSDLQLDQDKLTVVNRQFAEQNATVSLDLFMRYDFPKNAEQHLSTYIEAGRTLKRTYAQCRAELAQKQASLSDAELTYRHQDKVVKDFIQQIEFCTIRARAPGLVIYGSGEMEAEWEAMRGRGIISKGETVYEGLTLLSMPDTAEMVAQIGVHETDVDKVRPGQPAEIVMDAFPDQILQGEVIEVASMPDQGRSWLNPDLKLYETLVKINGNTDHLKMSMSCKVQILVQRAEDVVMVPIQVVSNRGGKKVCYVKTPRGVEEREVHTGAFNDTFTEITEGLQPGEEVLLNPPTFTEGVTDTSDSDQQRFGGRGAPEPVKAGDQAQDDTLEDEKLEWVEEWDESASKSVEGWDEGASKSVEEWDEGAGKSVEDRGKDEKEKYYQADGAPGGRKGRPGQSGTDSGLALPKDD